MSLHVRAWLAFLLALRRRLVAGSALLFCASSCLNPQPDPFPQADPQPGPQTPAGAGPNDSDGLLEPQPGASQSPPRPSADIGSEMAAPPSLPVTPGDPGGSPDAGAPPPLDGGAPDAAPPANGAL